MERRIAAPFDAHVHFRTGKTLDSIIHYTAKFFGDAVAMGNLKQPVDDLELLMNYYWEIKKATKFYPNFNPVMTIMLTPKTTANTIQLCAPYAKVLKLIPAGTSTNGLGIRLEDLEACYPILVEAKRRNMIFSIHAERIHDDNGKEIPDVAREWVALPFIEKLIRDIPGLKIIIEHVSTRAACELVLSSPYNVAATITAHHSCFNDSLLYDGTAINPEFYCKPVLKSEEDRRFVEHMMLNGNPKFFFGSDSAPHPGKMKFQNTPSAAGIFSAPVVMPIIAEKFAKTGKLDFLEDFVSIFGRQFYNLPIPKKGLIVSNEHPWLVPEIVGDEEIPVLMGGRTMQWSVRPVSKR